MDRRRVGSFAVSRDQLKRGDGRALFKLLVATTMFQRRQDVQIASILRGICASEARELTTQRMLLELVERGRCSAMKDSKALHDLCDLGKDSRGRSVCSFNPRVGCHLKRHTAVLRRYGDFGKAPTSAALLLLESGAVDLPGLRREIFRRIRTPRERARALEEELSRFWRIDKKIACMFLSAISNTALSPGTAPWSRGVDVGHFVVVDTNVISCLASMGFRADADYDERRAFIQALAAGMDLHQMDRRLPSYNPRIVQQAMYLFMSAANCRSLARDCLHLGAGACSACPTALSKRCPVRALLRDER